MIVIGADYLAYNNTVLNFVDMNFVDRPQTVKVDDKFTYKTVKYSFHVLVLTF